jgi:uncharacterized protein with HEPN domain
MQLEARKLLDDVKRAGEFILTATEGFTLDRYCEDELVRCAVERKFEIIGEALGRLLRVAPDVAELVSDARKIVAFRNTIIHAYDGIDDEIVWDVVQAKLPVLVSGVTDLLAVEVDDLSDEAVIVHRCDDWATADLLTRVLRDEGVQAVTVNASPSPRITGMVILLDRFDIARWPAFIVIVPASLAERAQEIVRDWLAAKPQGDEE